MMTHCSVDGIRCCDRSEFERYQVSVGGARRLAPGTVGRDEPASWRFEGLEPGAPYTVTVKTMSGKVTSWPAQADVALSEYLVLFSLAHSYYRTGRL